MGTTVDIFIRKISVIENGEYPKQEARNMLTAETWPEETAKIPGLKTLKLRDDETIDFSKIDRVSKKPFTKEQVLLLRRELNAPVDLNITLSNVDEAEPVEKFFAEVFKGAFKVAWTTLNAGIGNVIGVAIGGAAAKFHLESIKVKDHISIIGKGKFELDPSNLPPKPVTVPLFVSEKVERTIADFRAPDVEPRRKITVIEPDPEKPNALVVLEVVPY